MNDIIGIQKLRMSQTNSCEQTDPALLASPPVNELDDLVDLEGHYYRQGVLEGSEVGRQEGIEEGMELGYAKGFALASEIGFYVGVIDMLQACQSGPNSDNQALQSTSTSDGHSEGSEKPLVAVMELTEKLRKAAEALRTLALDLDENGSLKFEVLEQLHHVRSKFKLICAQLGLKLKFTGTTVDKVAEDELPQGMPSVEF